MQIQDFIQRWRETHGERANKDSYLKEFCRVLGLPEPDGRTGDPERDRYVFEADAVVYDEHGRRHVGKMDLYRGGCFVLEAKQPRQKVAGKAEPAKWGTPGWNLAMTEAAGQGFGYARTLDEPPPFVIVADIGLSFDLYACFDGTGAYRPFPNAQKHRLWLKDLDKHGDLFRKIWLDPMSLDPRRHSERVSKEVAADLAELAAALEAVGHAPELVAKFLMRCIFTMFAEDIGLLQDNVFTQYLERQWMNDPTSFKDGIEELWAAMNAGKRFYILGKLLRFNGGLFVDPVALTLTASQLRVLAKAAKHDWSEVEPAIFGTLVERALNPVERHRLGAHFTPTEYVRRLVRPTIEEPLRAEWEMVRVQLRSLVVPGEPSKPANVSKARKLVEDFQERLCSTRVLDPACGTGNFLYVAFHVFKQLESEVLATLDDLGVAQMKLDDAMTVTPKQFLGIEIRPGSKEIAELVLWIGYLQWHHKMFGGAKKPPEPILRDYGNIVCRDAILAPEISGMARARVTWPDADFVIGNPPFLGKLNVVADLGATYAASLREAYRGAVPDSADLVMYWWFNASHLAAQGRLRRFGFVTTNSITQGFNRRVVSAALAGKSPVHLTFAIADHPWVETANGAAVRVAMTVAAPGEGIGQLRTLVHEGAASESDGAVDVSFVESEGHIHADLRMGADVAGAASLAANRGLTSAGVMLGGRGFLISPDEIVPAPPTIVRPLLNGNDILQKSRRARVIDFAGLTVAEARQAAPAALQRVIDRVKPERDKNNRPSRRDRWWLFSEVMPQTRAIIRGLRRYIATPETSKHRVFTFVDGNTLPEHPLLAVGLDDAFFLGVMSSRVHVAWALAAGGHLGIGNDPRYNKTVCFDKFPFPACSSDQADRIRVLGEALDEHRKERFRAHPTLTITGVYNVLEKLRANEELAKGERLIHEQGLISILRQLHDELDEAVLTAYGWERDLSDEAVLQNLATLNAERAAEERTGVVRWLRPEIQKQVVETRVALPAKVVAAGQLTIPWPLDLPHQVAAVRDLINGTDTALTANDVAGAYGGATPDAVIPALQTLEALGLAVSYQNGSKRWRGLAKTTGERILRVQDSIRPASRPPPATGTTG